MSSMSPSDTTRFGASLTRAMHEHWRLFLAEGLILSLLGLAAIILPALAGVVTTVFLGWLLLISGIVGFVATWRAKGAPGFSWALLSSIIALLAGFVLLWNPMEGLATLTLVLTAFFVIDGLLMIVLAITHRRELSGRWEWLLLNGITDLVLAAIVIAGLPGTLLWVLGLLVGIDLLFGGAALIAMAIEARNEAGA